MVISLNFFELMNLLSCFQVPKKYEKKLNIWFVHLQVIFDQSPTSEKLELENLFCRWILEIWTWNLRGYISHVVAKKSLSIAPWRRKWRTRGWAVFCHTNESRKKSQRSQKAKRSSNQIKRVKENAWMLKLEKCVSCPVKEKQKLTAPGIPRRSPIQVLTRPDPA